MACTVYYRRCDGKGTKEYLSGLSRDAARTAQRQFFDLQPGVTMCWVLDEHGHMLGDVLLREPIRPPT